MHIPSLVVMLAACSPGTISTVQPGAVAKNALEGEWYWRRTVEDVPYGTAATFAGAQDDMVRLRFEIEEDLLLAYRSYPHIEGDGSEASAPVLAFPILDQFDIRRGYDRTTGEESNVIEENREQPWYDRDYIRVDWSTNLAEAPFAFAGLELDLLEWVTGDDRSDQAPQFDDSDGDGTIDSLMLSQRALVSPDTEEIPGYGDVPVCLFFGQAEYECGPVEIGLVHSFVRVGDRAPFDGVPYDDRHMETFGYFSTERLQWDKGYGLVEPNRVRYANHHPLWKESFQRDDQGRVLCAVGRDVAPCETFSAAEQPEPVKIPYREREVRPVVYHAGPDFPKDLIPAMSDVAQQWNEPLRDTVNGLRYWECIEGGGKIKDCETVRDPSLQMFVWCPNNPSLPGDPELCDTDHTGPEGAPDGVPDLVRVGDLRYHLAHIVRNPHLSSPYGYGPSAADPVGTTIALADGELALGAGEIISANAFLYEYVLDRVSHQVADLVQLLNGQVAPDAFVDGEDVSAWVDAVGDGDGAALAGGTYAMPTVWNTELVQQRLGLISNGFGPLLAPYLDTLGRPSDPTQMDEWLAAATDAIDRSAVFGAGAAEAEQNFASMMASPFDELAWTAETIGGYGFDPSVTGADQLSGRSPFEMLDPLHAAEREAGRVLAGQHAVDLDSEAAFTDGALLGLARDYASRGLTYDEIVTDVRVNSFREVMLHEVGHTLGLRHNFSGSFDAFNYRPEYWDLRLDGDVGPRHLDPETDEEINGRIREYQYSTIMDYPGSRNVGWAGLGYYDKAAVKFGYGQLVEVLTAVPDADAVPGLPNETGISFIAAYASSNVLPSVLLNYTDGSFLPLHYTDYPAMAGDLAAREDVPLSRLVPTIDESGSFADGLVVGEGKGGVAEGMPAVPYRFCSDEYAVGMTCARFDEGADPYESVSFLQERYWNDYLLTNFARQRYGFGDSGAYVARLEDRIFDPLRTWQRYYALFHGLFEAQTDEHAAEYFAADKGFGGWTAATDESFRFLARIVTRPEAGPHATTLRPDGTEVLMAAFDSEEQIDLVQGAYFESEWDTASGYFWFEHQSRVGTYWDRMLAMYSLTNTASYNYMGYDTASDPRQYAIGFQDLYRDELAVLLGRLMADEVDALAPARLSDGSLVYPDALQPGQSWPPAGAELVQPATYWLVRFDADLFGLSLTAHGYDRSFVNRSRIYVEGSGDAVTPAPDQAVVRFTDPASGKTYVAWSFPQLEGDGSVTRDHRGQPIELGASARMLRKALSLSERCQDLAVEEADRLATCAELSRYVSDLDLHIEMYQSFQNDGQ
jgi:hypothetical protein